MFKRGDRVEVKMGGSLGSWVPGVVTEVCQYAPMGPVAYQVKTDGGRSLDGVIKLRAPRAKPGKPAAPPRDKVTVRVTSGRGPLRLPKYKAWVKLKPCIFCHRKADDPHHYGPKGMGQTTDDTRLVPVCRQAHDALHGRKATALCVPTEVVLHSNDTVAWWASVDALVYRRQGDFLAEYIRIHRELS